MNTENLEALINFIEKPPKNILFDMHNFIVHKNCKTIACIAGHEYLRLERSDPISRGYHHVTNKVVLNVLKNLKKTGNVEWKLEYFY